MVLTKSQLERFKEAAREIATDEDEARLEEQLKKLIKQKPEEKAIMQKWTRTNGAVFFWP